MHYLYPLKRSSKLIETHDMLTFDTILPSDSNITCRKAKLIGKNKFLYSFRDARLAAKEDYKCACEFDVTRAHDNCSVIASEFCDFLS